MFRNFYFTKRPHRRPPFFGAFLFAQLIVPYLFICIYNGKSASAAKQQSEIAQKQMQEMVDQYNAVNRPMVTVRFDIIRSGLLCFVIENEGPLPAREVQIKVNEAFLENLSTIEPDNRLEDLNNVALYLASQQKPTLFIGSQVRFTDIAKVPAIFDISYNGTYNEHIEIDISQYNLAVGKIFRNQSATDNNPAGCSHEIICAMYAPATAPASAPTSLYAC